MKPIDNYLNRITMYRLVVYVLVIYAGAGVLAAFFGRLGSSPTQLVISLGLLLGSAYVADRAFACYFHVARNDESWLITGLILFLIVHPADSIISGLALVLAGAVSSASKYLLARHGKHIFNPAALAAALLSLTGLQGVTWWIGSAVFWPLTLLLGLAVVRKIRRLPLFLAFVAVAVAIHLADIVINHQPLTSTLQQVLVSSPLIFLATIMLTEPATMPPRRNEQLLFGGLVAALYAVAPQAGAFAVHSEVALLIGNVYAYLVSPKFRVQLRLKEVQRVSDWVYNFVFTPDRPFKFYPGQYMEWTLPGVPFDSRGNRRTFTIASSPAETDVHLGVKFYEPASQYKATLANLQPGEVVYASQLAGNFTLTGHEKDKLLFIAGGIGITPFRSMLKHLTDTNTTVDAVLIYAVSQSGEFAYTEVIREAARVGVRTILVVTQPGSSHPAAISSPLDAELLRRLAPDAPLRLCFVSGPNVMVDATKQHLRRLGVSSMRIKTDHFSGY